jgi:hypothetical protein
LFAPFSKPRFRRRRDKDISQMLSSSGGLAAGLMIREYVHTG